MRSTTARRRCAVGLADLCELAAAARRTTLLRIGLGLALVATLALTVLAGRSAGGGRAAVLPEGARTGVVVLDMSASISGPVYARVATVLSGIDRSGQAMGLVLFSDVAYELLPPGSPSRALLQFVRYFRPARYEVGAPVFPQTPWNEFSGGTRISAGLLEAAHDLRRAGVAHGAIVLVSDLGDPAADREPLVAASLVLARERIPVRIVPLFATRTNRALFASLFGEQAFAPPSAFAPRAGERLQPLAAPLPWPLLGLGALLALLLAANEVLNRRLEPGAAL